MDDKSSTEAPFVTTLQHAAADPFRLLVEAVKDYGIFMLDPAGNVSSWNPGAEAIKGYKAGEIIGRHVSCFYVPEDIAAGLPQQGLQLALKEGRFEEEGLRVRNDGSTFWAIVTITNIHDSFGNHIGYANVTRDITERKRAEDLLREKEAELADAVRVARMGYWSRNLATGILSWSEKLFDIFGLDPTAFDRRIESFLATVHPEDRKGVSERIAEAVATAGSFDHTYRICVRGEVRVIHERGSVTASADGKPLRIAGTAQDVTERVRAEECVRLSEERFRSFMDHNPAAAFIKDDGGRYVYVNPTWRRQFDPERFDCIGKTDHDIWPTATADIFQASDLACLVGNKVVQAEETALTPNGEKSTWLVMKFPLIDGDRRQVGGMSWNISDRKHAESELLLRNLAIESLVQGLCITDPCLPDNPIVYVNDSFLRITGYAREEVLGRNCRFLQGPDSDPGSVERLRTAVREEKPCAVELLNYRKDGNKFWNGMSIAPIRNAAGQVTNFVGVQTDITPIKLLEEQYRQAQKMEAVGRLAGGVAHDFNNLLTIISGYSQMLLGMLATDDRKRNAVQAIIEAGERAVGLTRQLLSFSRQTILETKVLDLNEVVRETEKLLRRMIGEDVLLTTILAPNIRRVKVDAGQLGQVLMNLAINARDAMPRGGKLTLETSNVELDATYAALHADCKVGSYVKLAVSDNGCGMTAEVQSRIFEPFFTTKEPGKGTGLGLATVYGIVKQSGGNISLYSEPQHGTTFKVYLPAVDEPVEPQSHDRDGEKAIVGTETVLLVEDDDAVRDIAALSLQTYGYTVLPAENGNQALRIVERHRGQIDLLLTDVVMPGMSGRELAEVLGVQYPKLKVLFVSGYTDDSVIRHGILHVDVAFLQKPYSPTSLARKVREVLDRH